MMKFNQLTEWGVKFHKLIMEINLKIQFLNNLQPFILKMLNYCKYCYNYPNDTNLQLMANDNADSHKITGTCIDFDELIHD